ncbi:MAG TPA: zf-HC2 domain-containing protein [Casimicrobiaceae bacterium]
MKADRCAGAVELSMLVEYWLGELDTAGEARIDEHLLSCDACAEHLDDMLRLGAAIRDGFVRGSVSAVLSAAFVRDLASSGWRIREYRVASNGSVNCTVAPDDDLTVARLQASLAGVERLDVVRIAAGNVLERLTNVPFDATSGEVVFAPAMSGLRALHDQTVHIQLVDADGNAERVIAGYDFNHSPWNG